MKIVSSNINVISDNSELELKSNQGHSQHIRNFCEN